MTTVLIMETITVAFFVALPVKNIAGKKNTQAATTLTNTVGNIRICSASWLKRYGMCESCENERVERGIKMLALFPKCLMSQITSSFFYCVFLVSHRALTCMLPRVKENPLEYIKLKTFALECLQRQPFQTPPFHISERLLDAIVTFWSHITEHVTVFSAFNSPFLATKASNILSETLVLLTRLDNANLGDTPTTEMPQCTSAALQGCEKLICYCVDQVIC